MKFNSNLKKLVSFGFIGALGVLVNTFFLFIFTEYFGIHHLIAAGMATELAIIFNFFGNHNLTFKNNKSSTSLGNKFLKFQMVSLTTLALTIALLALFTTIFGLELLLVWNACAILITFVVNFSLNRKFTWPSDSKKYLFVVFFVGVILASAMGSAADIVAVSQLGYHPSSVKQVVVYTSSPSGSFGIFNSTSKLVYNGTLARPTDASGNPVNCQGNLPCLVGNFTGFTKEGTYFARSMNVTTSSFVISKSVFSSTIPTFMEFFNAQAQRGSDYHEDFHTYNDPAFTTIADGSFIMESYQAAVPLIRMGSAYRRNPSIFTSDNHQIYAPGKPDMQEYILLYVDYLEGLQGLNVSERTDGVGFRLNPLVEPKSAFVPGPTNLTNLDIYVPGNAIPLKNVPVVSLCGLDDGSNAWDNCIAYAAKYYKCQIDEPCLNLTYQEKTGVVKSRNNGYAVSKGWNYEFGCFFDSDFNQQLFNSSYNPCMIFYPETSSLNTVQALTAFLESVPAVTDYSHERGVELFDRSRNTYLFVKENYPSHLSDANEAAYFGTSAFLMYDYTGNLTYLSDAYSARDIVNKTLGDSWTTNSNEFYWEEYIRHKDVLNSNGFSYLVSGTQDPSEYFNAKMYGDYNNNDSIDISQNGERVLQKFRSYTFQNSRAMLNEGVIASKSSELIDSPAYFIPLIADSQLSWLTGVNAVQNGTALGSNLTSYSFIFGIGKNTPTQFHSRYLVDTNYRDDSNGQIIGARGTGLQFLNSSGGFTYLDGFSTILGQKLGAMGNEYRGEVPVTQFDTSKTFKNGKKYIPGWINGAYDIETEQETDVIFNYLDNLNTYEYTETTNEMVAAAIELFAFQDGRMNNKTRPGGYTFEEINEEIKNGTLSLTTTPVNANISIDGVFFGVSPLNVDLMPGLYTILANASGYYVNQTDVSITSGNISNVLLTLTEIPILPENGTISISSTPSGANILINNMPYGSTPSVVSLNPGNYTVRVELAGYVSNETSVELEENENEIVDLNMNKEDVSIPIVEIISPIPGVYNYSINEFAFTSSDDIGVVSCWYVLNGDNETIPSCTSPVGISSMEGSNSLEVYAQDSSGKVGSDSVVFVIDTVEENSTIIDSSDSDSDDYIYETENIRFGVELDKDDSVVWSINSIPVNVTSGTEHEFSWTPDIFVAGAEGNATVQVNISASTDSDEVSWIIVVDDSINPYFGEGSVAHVFTDNNFREYTGVNLSIRNDNSGSVTQYTLIPTVNDENDETDWKNSINVECGNNVMMLISAYNNETNETDLYDLPLSGNNARGIDGGACGSSDGGSGGGSGSGGGGSGGSGGGSNTKVELVYVILSNDVVNLGDSETITLDAKSTGSGISKVNAILLTPEGNFRTIPLTRVGGDGGYGTWSATFSDFRTGLYYIHSIDLYAGGNTPTKVNVQDRTFYVVDEVVAADEKLEIVYTTLSDDRLEEAGPVTLRLDARDASGISKVEATIETSRGASFILPLTLVSGDASYGTWETIIEANESDTTYRVASISLSNGDQSKIHPISERSVYVVPGAAGSVSPITAAAISDNPEGLLKRPFVPTLLAFGVMIIVLIAASVGISMRKRWINRNA